MGSVSGLSVYVGIKTKTQSFCGNMHFSELVQVKGATTSDVQHFVYSYAPVCVCIFLKLCICFFVSD